MIISRHEDEKCRFRRKRCSAKNERSVLPPGDVAPLVSGTPFGHLSKTHQTPPRCTRGHFHTLRAFELPVQEVRDLRIHRGRVFAREIDVVIWVRPAEDRKLRAMPP